MRAIDPNIVVHYLTGDEPKQAARARTVIDAGDVIASTTVPLENEWVLRSIYGFSYQANRLWISGPRRPHHSQTA